MLPSHRTSEVDLSARESESWTGLNCHEKCPGITMPLCLGLVSVHGRRKNAFPILVRDRLPTAPCEEGTFTMADLPKNGGNLLCFLHTALFYSNTNHKCELLEQVHVSLPPCLQLSAKMCCCTDDGFDLKHDILKICRVL